MTAAAPPLPVVGQSSGCPRPFRWTCDLLSKVWDTGRLEGQNLFLVNGELLENDHPGPPHDMSVGLADYWLKSVFTPGYVVRIQCGLVFGVGTDPGPDLAVVPGSPRDFKKTPRTAVLVVEVSDTSLAYDRGEKANLYAAAGIPDYWVLDVVNGRLEVFRDPRPDPGLPFGAGYARVTAHGPADTVAPREKPTATVTLAELLP